VRAEAHLTAAPVRWIVSYSASDLTFFTMLVWFHQLRFSTRV
jgi:hypothetical protein